MTENSKEFLYVMYYITVAEEVAIKIGTTNNIERRMKEHNRNYAKAPNFPMKDGTKIELLWSIPLSKYNTLRYEDLNKAIWQAENFGQFVRNDRFIFDEMPTEIKIKIRKEYTITLA